MCTTSRTTLHLRRRRRCALLRRLQNSSDQKRPAWSGGERMTAAEELRAAAPFFRRSGAIANYVDQSVATESLQGLESYLQTPSTVGSATNAGRAGACNLPVANLQATRSLGYSTTPASCGAMCMAFRVSGLRFKWFEGVEHH